MSGGLEGAAYQEMLMTAASAVVMIDRNGRIVFANPMAERMFGYAPDELLAQPFERLVPARLRALYRRRLADLGEARAPGAGDPEVERTGLRNDGSEFPVEVFRSSMQRADGPVTVAFITDVTERRDAERRLRAYQDELRQMAVDVQLVEERERRRIASELHDQVGQALALALLKLSSARDAVAGAPRADLDEAVALIDQSVARTRTLIFDLSPPVLHDLGLPQALTWLAEDVERRHGLRVELTDEGLDAALDDASATLVFRAVRELLTNVWKHARTASATVTLRRSGACCEVEVEDKGLGFEVAGHGLQYSSGYGLFSVREQIARLGGAVAISSAPGHGTRVGVRVPLPGDGPPPGAPKGTP
jgi:PAS domain S-box-containing protein